MARSPDNLLSEDEIGETLLDDMGLRAASCLGVKDTEVSFVWGDDDKGTCGYEVRDAAGKCVRGESGFSSLLEALDGFLEWCGDDEEEDDDDGTETDVEEPED